MRLLFWVVIACLVMATQPSGLHPRKPQHHAGEKLQVKGPHPWDSWESGMRMHLSFVDIPTVHLAFSWNFCSCWGLPPDEDAGCCERFPLCLEHNKVLVLLPITMLACLQLPSWLPGKSCPNHRSTCLSTTPLFLSQRACRSCTIGAAKRWWSHHIWPEAKRNGRRSRFLQRQSCSASVEVQSPNQLVRWLLLFVPSVPCVPPSHCSFSHPLIGETYVFFQAAPSMLQFTAGPFYGTRIVLLLSPLQSWRERQN